jgi:nitrogen fixation-related uncharacterized protein
MTPMKRLNGARITVIATAIGIVLAGVYGFGSKLEEFIHLLNDPEFTEGRFALIPILNYFLASAGFPCMFLWAARNGMFKDLERPKYDMLKRERELDAEDESPWEDAKAPA